MPMTIQEKVIEYYEHKYQRKFFDEHRIIQEPSMSDPLRRVSKHCFIQRHLGYERVYLPLYKVADRPFHVQGDDKMDNL